MAGIYSFGKLLNLASDEVILELVRAKFIPTMLYGLECFQLGKAVSYMGVQIPRGKGQFLGKRSPIVKYRDFLP